MILTFLKAYQHAIIIFVSIALVVGFCLFDRLEDIQSSPPEAPAEVPAVEAQEHSSAPEDASNAETEAKSLIVSKDLGNNTSITVEVIVTEPVSSTRIDESIDSGESVDPMDNEVSDTEELKEYCFQIFQYNLCLKLRDRGFSEYPYAFQVAVALAVIIPLMIVILARVRTTSSRKAEMLLKYLSRACIGVVGSLAYKQFVFDAHLADLSAELSGKGSFKELFGFEITLFSFLAGFILLNTLQEYSETKKDRNEEIQRWYSLRALLEFFKDPDFKPTKDLPESHAEDEENNNHDRAQNAIDLIHAIDLDDTTGGKSPGKTLSAVYSKIIRLDVEDDNDRPALNHLVDQYIRLDLLINSRQSSEDDAPNRLLVNVLWAVGIITCLFAVTAVFWTFNEGYREFSELVLGKFVMSFLLLFVILPVIIIIMTIDDLKNPNNGLWSIDMNERYKKMTTVMKREAES